ncbi:hypothetical protein C8Q73DRAFT_712867 [Cubamyces lactineus]|nr:hypothetical protein C8Q73DRAFT_712867 [Cubamyces lactineus]
MESVYEALKAVQAAVTKVKTKEKIHLTETVAQLSSQLVLLKLQMLSNKVADKLSKFLRDSFSALYTCIELPALHLASCVFKFTYHERLLPAIGTIQREQQYLWERVLYGLLAGILDFLDTHDTKGSKNAVGEALYPALSDMCFSLSAPKTCVDLRCTAYNILCDSAASHQDNQQKLRDKDVLGGERLGSCIWRTKDYLALEGLLNVFARALPSTYNSASGRAKRTAYIQSVFVTRAPPELISTGRAIADLLENVPTSDWEETALKIVDVLAKANITFPQPFDVDEVIACGVRCPSDRLYADDQTFLANVLLEDGQYESLEIAYSSIAHIHVEEYGDGVVQVRLSLERPPKLGKDHLEEKSDGGVVFDTSALFTINANHRNKFLEALENRKLDHLLLHRAPVSTLKLSIATKPANLELDHAGRIVPELSQEERIETVAQFYKTDELSDDITPSEGVGDMRMVNNLLSPLPQSERHSDCVKANEITSRGLASERHLSAMDQDSSTTSGLDRKPPLAVSGPLSRTDSHLIRAAVFGLSDEELSDISDCESPVLRSKVIRRSGTSASLVRGRLSFQPLQTKSTGTSSSATRVARGGIGIVVLDSDDGSPAAAPISPGAQRSKKAALIRPPTLDDSQIVSAAHFASTATAVPAAASLTLDPLAQPAVSSPLPGDHTLGSSDILGKVLRFSDILAPNFNAPLSSPAIVPRSALKSAFTKKNAVSGRLVDLKVLDSTAAAKEIRSGQTPFLVDRATDCVEKARNILNDLAPASSSPTPGPKKSVKVNLRKREVPQYGTAGAAKPPIAKRKHTASQAPAEVERDRATKRPRTVARAIRASGDKEDAALPTEIANERSESQVLRPRTTAATRATRRYHVRKGRTSSPHTEGPLATIHAPVIKTKASAVDYDALPSPPRTSNAPPRPSSPPIAKSTVKPKAKANVVSAGKPKPQAIAGPAHAAATQAPVVLPKRTPCAKIEKAAAMNRERTDITELAITSEPIVTLTKPDTPQRRPKRRTRVKPPSAGLKENTPAQTAKVLPPFDQEAVGVEYHPSSIVCVAETMCVPRNGAPGTGHDNATSDAPGQLAGQHEPVVAEDNNPRRSVKKSTTTPWDAAFVDRDLPTFDAGRSHDTPTLAVATVVPVSDSSAQVTHDHNDNEKNLSLEATTALPSVERIEIIEVAPLNNNDPANLSEDAKMGSTTAIREASSARSGDDLARQTRSLAKRSEKLPTSLPPERLRWSPIGAKKEVEMIDLTLDTPSRPILQARVELKSRPSLSLLSPDTMRTAKTLDCPADDELASFRHGNSDDTKSRYFPHENEMTSGHMRHVQHRHAGLKVRSIRERELEEALREKVVPESKYRASPPLESFVNVIEQLHEVIVHNMVNKFEDVRREARLGRNELLRDAGEDLGTMRAESVEHFNQLVDLEAEYATAGRSLIHGSEDWLKVNRELTEELKTAIEMHDRTMLSKKIPTSLITLTF